jgi:rhodanese-related sulfurtransferase
MQSITVMELQKMLKDNVPLQLIDVREPDEHTEFNIGGELIPLGDITRFADKITTDKPVVLYCRKGIRSQFAIQKLLEKYPFTNLINLTGGMIAWQLHFGHNTSTG